jgi:hypothetical protein
VSTSASDQPAAPSVSLVVEALVAGLVDDAAVFPPRSASPADAVAEHRAHRSAWYADAVGPLVVRADQVADLLDVVAPGDDLQVAVVGSAEDGLAGLVEAAHLLLDQEGRAELAQVEIPLPTGHDPGVATRTLVDQLALSVPAYVEVPRAGFESALDVLAEDGAERAKLRTGGTSPQAYPSEAELAAFLRACVERRVPFKLTAGLHTALRTTTAEGVEAHGLLNVLAAVAAAVDGAATEDLAGLLAVRTAQPLLPVVAGADVAAVRGLFLSFGCCAVTDPLGSLASLGLLTADV